MPCIVTRAAVVFWQIKTDNLDHIWPIKMLRIIVIITITTLFPTFLELCLDPLDVSTYTALSLRPFLHSSCFLTNLQCDFWSDATPCTARYRSLCLGLVWAFDFVTSHRHILPVCDLKSDLISQPLLLASNHRVHHIYRAFILSNFDRSDLFVAVSRLRPSYPRASSVTAWPHYDAVPDSSNFVDSFAQFFPNKSHSDYPDSFLSLCGPFELQHSPPVTTHVPADKLHQGCDDVHADVQSFYRDLRRRWL